MALRPSKFSDARIQVSWKTFTGQHWRKPIALIASEEIVLKPFSETVVPVKEGEREREGIFGECGLITPNRSKQVIDCKFSTAYGFTKERTNKVIIANTTCKEVVIKRNCQVAELHPRDESVFVLQSPTDGDDVEECTVIEAPRKLSSPTDGNDVAKCTVFEARKDVPRGIENIHGDTLSSPEIDHEAGQNDSIFSLRESAIKEARDNLQRVKAPFSEASEFLSADAASFQETGGSCRYRTLIRNGGAMAQERETDSVMAQERERDSAMAQERREKERERESDSAMAQEKREKERERESESAMAQERESDSAMAQERREKERERESDSAMAQERRGDRGGAMAQESETKRNEKDNFSWAL